MTGFLKGLRASLSVLLLLLFLAVPARSEVVDRIVAVVNDSLITLSELNAAAALASDEFRLVGGSTDPVDVKSEVLDSLIEQKLVKQAGERAGIEVGEDEIDAAVDDVRQKNGLSHEALLVVLLDSGLTYKEYRKQLKEQIREVKFIDIRFRSRVDISPEDLREYYIQHSEDFMAPPAVRLRVIFLSNKDPELKEKRLQAVLDGLAAGVDFASLASDFSEGPAVKDGGDIGFVPYGELDPQLADEAKRFGPGEISAPIVGEAGTSIIQIIEKREAEPKLFEEVEGRIRQEVFKRRVEEKFNYWLKDMKEVAHIEVRL